jgi:hypothetical protein
MLKLPICVSSIQLFPAENAIGFARSRVSIGGCYVLALFSSIFLT